MAWVPPPPQPPSSASLSTLPSARFKDVPLHHPQPQPQPQPPFDFRSVADDARASLVTLSTALLWTIVLTCSAASLFPWPAHATDAATTEDLKVTTTMTPPPPPPTATTTTTTMVDDSAATTLRMTTGTTPSATTSTAALQRMEQEVIAEMNKDIQDEIRTQQETNALIGKLERDAVVSTTTTTQQHHHQQQQQPSETTATTPATTSQSTTTPPPPTTQLQQQLLVEELERYEEIVEQETLTLMEKVKALQAAEQADIDANRALNKVEQVAETTQEAQETAQFLQALDERSSDTQDLIAQLKAKSQAYYNDKTGRYNSMSKPDFERRARTYSQDTNVLLELLKVREQSTQDFLATYGEFLSHLGRKRQGAAPSSLEITATRPAPPAQGAALAAAAAAAQSTSADEPEKTAPLSAFMAIQSGPLPSGPLMQPSS